MARNRAGGCDQSAMGKHRSTDERGGLGAEQAVYQKNREDGGKHLVRLPSASESQPGARAVGEGIADERLVIGGGCAQQLRHRRPATT